MPIIELDHLIVAVRGARRAAEQLAAVLDVPWSPTGVGPFCPVYVNHHLTLDFDEAEGEPPVLHYAFAVDDAAFDAIVSRLASMGIAYRGTPHGPDDGQINTAHGGRIVYWSEPGGPVWEALTVSYARR